ncbi:MAG: hypothetical protein Q8K55_01495 [Gemmatimonadaceae bacterium]|nr:hypothetical protein [Gemmatimonadaceae bacterium]
MARCDADRDGWQGDPLTDPLARDHARPRLSPHFQVERRAAASTVNLALAPLDAPYRCLQRGRPRTFAATSSCWRRRALDEDDQRRLLRAADGAPMWRALVMLMLFNALRISKTAASTSTT